MTMDVVSVEDDLSVPRPAQVSRAYTHTVAQAGGRCPAKR